MFFSDPDLDLKIMLWLLGMAAGIAGVIYWKWKQVCPTILFFSLLANAMVYLNSGSRFFDIYSLKWIVVFTLEYWPYLNTLFLIICVSLFLKKRYAK